VTQLMTDESIDPLLVRTLLLRLLCSSERGRILRQSYGDVVRVVASTRQQTQKNSPSTIIHNDQPLHLSNPTVCSNPTVDSNPANTANTTNTADTHTTHTTHTTDTTHTAPRNKFLSLLQPSQLLLLSFSPPSPPHYSDTTNN